MGRFERRLTRPQYVVMALDDHTTLSAERRLQVSSDLSLTDGGESGDVTIGAVTTQTGAGSKIPKLDASGRLRLGVDPSNVLDAATKQYVDGIGGGSHNLLSAQHPDTTVGTVVAGDLIVGDATPKWARLAKGATTYVLKAGASILAWGQVAFSELTGALGAGQHGSQSDGDHTGALSGNARLAVRKNTGAVVGTRRRLNLIEGANVTLTVADDATDEEVDVTIAAAGGTDSVTVLTRQPTEVEVVNTIIETTVWTYSVPGGTLSTNRALRLSVIGWFGISAGVSPTYTVRLKYGGTTFWTGSWAIGPVNLGYGLLIDAMIGAANSTDAQRARGELVAGGGTDGIANAAPIAHRVAMRDTLAINSTVAQDLVMTFQMSASDAWTRIVCSYLVLERLGV